MGNKPQDWKPGNMDRRWADRHLGAPLHKLHDLEPDKSSIAKPIALIFVGAMMVMAALAVANYFGMVNIRHLPKTTESASIEETRPAVDETPDQRTPMRRAQEAVVKAMEAQNDDVPQTIEPVERPRPLAKPVVDDHIAAIEMEKLTKKRALIAGYEAHLVDCQRTRVLYTKQCKGANTIEQRKYWEIQFYNLGADEQNTQTNLAIARRLIPNLEKRVIATGGTP